ncbi:tetratricopeptide repeat protein [Streptomyces sp. NPDC054844]
MSPALAPIEVRVTADGAAEVGGMPVVVDEGEQPQEAVLNYLHRLALATGHAVRAAVCDERIRYVTAIQVHLDGSSQFTSPPAPLTSAPLSTAHLPKVWGEAAPAADVPGPQGGPPGRQSAVRAPAPGGAVEATTRREPELGERPAAPAPPGSGPESPASESATQVLYARRVPPAAPVPPAKSVLPAAPVTPESPTLTLARGAASAAGTKEVSPAGPSLLAEPVARINEALGGGRIEFAATLAQQSVADASARFGHEHSEVLRLRELDAYVAYRANDGSRAFRASMEVARAWWRTKDPQALQNVLNAAAAWRLVADPAQGLLLGEELIDLWAEIVTELPGSDDGHLAGVRTRMDRLAQRAGRSAG